jgi:hypothetical protein
VSTLSSSSFIFVAIRANAIKPGGASRFRFCCASMASRQKHGASI